MMGRNWEGARGQWGSRGDGWGYEVKEGQRWAGRKDMRGKSKSLTSGWGELPAAFHDRSTPTQVCVPARGKSPLPILALYTPPASQCRFPPDGQPRRPAISRAH